MKLLCIRHVGFEGPGIIQDWAEENGHELHVVRIWLGEQLPKAISLDGLIIMGGPMGACDDDQYPWMASEKNLIASAIDLGIPVLGICLGAQIIANVMGAKVYPNDFKEIGWFPVELTDAGEKHQISSFLPKTFITFHWHGDTFDLPDGATHLIRSAGCAHQAYIKGKTLGLQFHMEMTEEGVEEVSDRCAHELVDAPYIQSQYAMLGSPELRGNHLFLKEVLNIWTTL